MNKERLKELTDLIGEDGLAQLLSFRPLNQDLTEKWTTTHPKDSTAQDHLTVLLRHAILDKDDQTLNFLIEKNKRRKFLDTDSAIILHFAIQSQKESYVEKLLKAGFDPNGSILTSNSSSQPAVTSHQFTALASGTEGILWLLLQYGANRDQTNQDGFTLLEIAERSASKEQFQAFKEKMVSVKKEFPMLHLIHSGKVEAVQALLESGYVPNDSVDTSDLFAALSIPSIEMIKLLLLHGANPLQLNSEGVSFLKAAESLLKPEELNTVLMSSIPRPVILAMSELIGADGLHCLEKSRALTVRNVQTFLNLEKENPSPSNESAKYFLQILFLLSAKNETKDFYQLLLEMNAKNNFLENSEIVQVAITQEDVSTLRQVLASGFDINSITAPIPLFSALSLGSLEIIRVLLEHGANPLQKKDKDEVTFLRAAQSKLTEDEFNKVLFYSIPRPMFQELSNLIGQEGLDLLESAKLLSVGFIESTLKLEVESPLPSVDSAKDFLNNLYLLSKRGDFTQFTEHLLKKNAENNFLNLEPTKPLNLLGLQTKVKYVRDFGVPAEVSLYFTYRDQELDLSVVNEWFTSKGIKGVVVYKKPLEQEFDIRLNHDNSQGFAKLIDVITVLAEHNLGLTDQANKEMHMAYLEAKLEIANKELTEKDRVARTRVLRPYLRGEEELQTYFRMFPNDFGPREKNLFRYFDLFVGLDTYFTQLDTRLFQALSSDGYSHVLSLLKEGANPLQKNPDNAEQSFLAAAEDAYWPMESEKFFEILMRSLSGPIYHELFELIGEEGISQLKASEVLSTDLIEEFLIRIRKTPEPSLDSAKYLLNRLFKISSEDKRDRFCDYLIEKNAKERFLDPENPFVLDYAITRKKPVIVGQLLEMRFDPNGNKSDLYPAKRHLFSALSSGVFGNLQLLLRFGADPLQTDQYFRTFFQVAKEVYSVTEPKLLVALYWESIPSRIYEEIALLIGYNGRDLLRASDLLDENLTEDLLKRVRGSSESPSDSAKYFLNRLFELTNESEYHKLRSHFIENNRITPFLENPVPEVPNSEDPEKNERMKEILAVLTQDKFDQFKLFLEECEIAQDNILQNWLRGANHYNSISLDHLFGLSLHIAIMYNHHQLFDFLLLNKLLTAQACVGSLITPIERKNKHFLQCLLNYGVDPNADVRQCRIHDNPNNTYLFWAYHCKSIACMKILLEAGAKTNTVHFKTKKTVLEMAREDGRDDVIALIEKVEKERGIVSDKKDEELSEHTSAKSSESGKDKSKEESTDQESSSEEEPTALEQCIRGIFSNVAKGTDTYEHISDQWTARGKSTVSDEDMKAMPNFIEEKLNADNFEAQLKTEDLDIHVRRELQNMIAYTSKLYREYQNDAKGNKKKVLGEKVDAATEFIRKVLSQEELTEASIRKAYNSFEQRDHNRSTGLYRLYARWHDQWYEEKKGKKKTERLVKSTLGTFGNLLYKAVENQVVEVKEEEEQLERSSVQMSSGG